MSFDNIHSHEVMLRDERRTRAYEKAIEKSICGNEKVLDFGCGSGILSFFASRSGADHVFAVDRSRFIRVAREIAQKNRIDNIDFYHDDESTLSLPEPVDLIVWEGLGSLAIDEWSLDPLLCVRDRFLTRGGNLIPNKISIFGGLVSDATSFENSRYFNTKPYDVDFSFVSDWPLHRVTTKNLSNEVVLSPFIHFGSYDLLTLKSAPKNLQGSVTVDRATPVHGICGWFEAVLADNVTICNGPTAPSTHWGQLYFPLKEPFMAVPGKPIDVNICPSQGANKKSIQWIWSIEDGEQMQRLDNFAHAAWVARDLPKGRLV